MNALFSDEVDEIQEPRENDGEKDWIAANSDPLMAPRASNKYGALTIAGLDNAELPNMQNVEIKEGTTILLMDGPVTEALDDSKWQSTTLCLKLSFPAMNKLSSQRLRDFAKLPEAEVTNRSTLEKIPGRSLHVREQK